MQEFFSFPGLGKVKCDPAKPGPGENPAPDVARGHRFHIFSGEGCGKCDPANPRPGKSSVLSGRGGRA
jgi:hypothetical protein